MKTEIVRCKRCKKNTLIDIASEPQQINAFTIRSYVGVQCTVLNENDKLFKYVYK